MGLTDFIVLNVIALHMYITFIILYIKLSVLVVRVRVQGY